MIDDIGHVLLGGVLCYAFIPTAELWILVVFAAACGAVREHIQSLRDHPQIWWHQYTDTVGFVVGALIYWYLRGYAGLDADYVSQQVDKLRASGFEIKKRSV